MQSEEKIAKMNSIRQVKNVKILKKPFSIGDLKEVTDQSLMESIEV